MAEKTIIKKGVLYINGKQVDNTFSALRAQVSKLERELKKIPVGTQDFIDKAQDLKRVTRVFKEVRDEVQGVNQQILKSEGTFARLIGGDFFRSMLSFQGLGTLFGGVRNTIQDLLDISDAITNVQKTSGLAQKEVEELWSEFSNLNTRTSKLDLLKIAEIGGRLGITDKEQIKEFTQEIDKINVALGDSFQGGLEEITTKVGKLKNLFEETKNSDYGTALNEIGSALNELGANGTASESNITDFATRMGQLPSILKPAIDKTLGLGAAFEETGINAEIGASGFTKFVTTAASHLPEFAKQLKISTHEAKKLLNEKPEEFFLKFSESVKGLGSDQLAGVLNGLGLKTQEVIKAVGAAGDNADRFREMMELSAKAMIEANSIDNEFQKKNENAAAVWEKIGKVIKEFITDGIIPEFFNMVTDIIGKITGITSKAGDGIEKMRSRLTFLVKTLAVVTTAVVSYKTAMYLVAHSTKSAWQQTILYNAIMKTKAVLTNVVQAATTLYGAAVSFLSGQFKQASYNMIFFNHALKANPLGLFLGTLTAVITAMSIFGKKQKEISQQNKEFINSTNKEITQLGTLRKMIADNNIPLEKRKELIEKLKQKYPEYLKDIKNEGTLTKELADKLNQVNKELILKARLKENESLIEEQSQIAADAQKEMEQAEKMLKNSIYKLRDKAYLDKYDKQLEGKSLSQQALKIIQIHTELNRKNLTANLQSSFEMFKEAKKTFDLEQKKLSELIDVSSSLENKYKTNKDEKADGSTDLGDVPDKNVPTPSKKYTGNLALSAEKELLKTRRDLLKKQQELQDESTAVEIQSLDKQLSAMEVKYERKKIALQQENQDIAIVIEEHQGKIKELSEKSSQEDISKQEKNDIRKAIEIEKQILAEKQKIAEQNVQMQAVLEQTKQHELNKIREQWDVKQFDIWAKNFEKRMQNKKAENELEIAQISSLEEAKAKLEKVGYQGELAKIRDLETAKKALREQANKVILEETLKSLEVQEKLLLEALENLSGEAAEKLNNDLDALAVRITEVKTALAHTETTQGNPTSVQGTEAENVDILGFTAGQWEETFNNLDTAEGKLKAVGMAMQALANAGSIYAELQRASNEKELRSFTKMQEQRKRRLEEQVNAGIITQATYYNSVKEMEVEAANKKAELEYKQAKAEKAFRLFAAIGSTAQAVSAALTAGPILGPIMAGIVGALGAVQISIIASQGIPNKQSYAKGGYTSGLGFTDETGEEVAGVVHKNEYVIPQWLLAQPKVANVAQWIENLRTHRNVNDAPVGFVKGGYTDKDTAIEHSSNEVFAESPSIENAIERLNDILDKLEKNGVDAYLLADAKNGKLMHQAIKKFQKIQDTSRNTTDA